MTDRRHGHVADDEQAVRAHDHGVGPREPDARHVDDDIVEIGRHQIEQANDERRFERAHFARLDRRGDQRQAGRMARQHDVEQLAVETLGRVLDFLDIEARFDIEIFGAGAKLEIEVDDAGRAAGLPAETVEDLGAFQRHDRRADTAGSRHEGQELRFDLGFLARPLQRVVARAHEVGGLQRLDQEVMDLELDQDARGGRREIRGDDQQHAIRASHALDLLQGLEILDIAGVDIEDQRVGGEFADFVGNLLDVLVDEQESDFLGRADGALGHRHQCRILGDQHQFLFVCICVAHLFPLPQTALAIAAAPRVAAAAIAGPAHPRGRCGIS